ncbi:DNA mismatch repair endonuclease MutL [Legionella sp. W05-934-2]|uniref:DNA mismatch repair endonuclease MutL n=1 Tax=Legionella sp. W05-934-2 TaxID=1198649 RepID=UPI0034622B0D
MILRIQTLPSDLANQIAAGEVIERPASVVKELLENARDAGATQIHIDVEYAGLNGISVADNGFGIHPDDLPLAVAAHATSKIKTLNDLYAIHTMGFRGEALASIASVARLTIQSKTDEMPQASELRWHEQSWQVNPCARQRGTTVEVRDLFYNAPVRKRFLKSERTEFHALEGVVRRFALSTPKAAIMLRNNGKIVLQLPAATDDKRLLVRLEKLFGKPFIQAAHYVDAERAGMRLSGWISDATYQRSQSDKLWIYVNQRMVKDKLLNHALKQAYESVIYPGRHPACLLYLTIDPAEVDVNVHPTKHELRFQQPRLVHDFIYSQITDLLGSKPIADKQSYQSTLSTTSSPLTSRWQISEPTRPVNIPGMHQSININPVSSHSVSNDYGIFQWQGHWLLWHKPVLIEAALTWHCNQQSFPLPSRPLLVPLSHPLTPGDEETFVDYLPLLSQLGLTANIQGNALHWQGTPLMLSQLPLHVLVDQILDAKPQTISSMLSLIIKAYIEHLPSIDASIIDLMTAYCDAHQPEIEQNQLNGMIRLTDNHCRSILYG